MSDRDQILLAAERLFSTLGFDQVSLDTIEAEADRGRGATHRFWLSKRELYFDLVRTRAWELCSGLDNQLREARSDAEVLNLYLLYLPVIVKTRADTARLVAQACLSPSTIFIADELHMVRRGLAGRLAFHLRRVAPGVLESRIQAAATAVHAYVLELVYEFLEGGEIWIGGAEVHSVAAYAWHQLHPPRPGSGGSPPPRPRRGNGGTQLRTRVGSFNRDG